MNKKLLLLPAIIFSAIILIFFYLLLIDRNPTDIPSALIDKKIPNFETKSLLTEKNLLSSDVFTDGITLVNFFATWCKPCRDEHDYMKKLSNDDGYKIIGINYKDNNKKAIEWLKNLGNPYAEVAIDKKGSIAIDWGVYGIPETFIINSNGIIIYRHVGPVTKKIYKKINIIISDLK